MPMPLTKKGRKVKPDTIKPSGEGKGAYKFYVSENAETISGVTKKKKGKSK